MKLVKVKSLEDRVSKVRSLIASSGNRIGVVHFVKRSDGKKRRMAYRLHVSHPTYAPVPVGHKHKETKRKDRSNDQITVFDVNKVRYNNKHRMCGRGDFRTIPLESVTRVAVNGEIYKIIE